MFEQKQKVLIMTYSSHLFYQRLGLLENDPDAILQKAMYAPGSPYLQDNSIQSSPT